MKEEHRQALAEAREQYEAEVTALAHRHMGTAGALAGWLEAGKGEAGGVRGRLSSLALPWRSHVVPQPSDEEGPSAGQAALAFAVTALALSVGRLPGLFSALGLDELIQPSQPPGVCTVITSILKVRKLRVGEREPLSPTRG